MEPTAIPSRKKIFLIDLLLSIGLIAATIGLLNYYLIYLLDPCDPKYGLSMKFLGFTISAFLLIPLIVLGIIKRNLVQRIMIALRILQLCFIGVSCLVLFVISRLSGLGGWINNVYIYSIIIFFLFIIISAIIYRFILDYTVDPSKNKSVLMIVLCSLISLAMLYFLPNLIFYVSGIQTVNSPCLSAF